MRKNEPQAIYTCLKYQENLHSVIKLALFSSVWSIRERKHYRLLISFSLLHCHILFKFMFRAYIEAWSVLLRPFSLLMAMTEVPIATLITVQNLLVEKSQFSHWKCIKMFPPVDFIMGKGMYIPICVFGGSFVATNGKISLTTLTLSKTVL